MKRKLSETAEFLSDKINGNDAEKTKPTLRHDTTEVSEDYESASITPYNKRRRSDTTSAENVLSDTHLLESIRMKLMELQSELCGLDDSDDENVDSPSLSIKEHARILGFATCAQETFRFLHDHGVNITDRLYVKLSQAFSDRIQCD